MKNLRNFILLIAMFSMTSCLDIVEELSLKKNGTGKYVLTMDMSALMEEGMKDMLKGMAEQEGEGDVLADMPSELDTILYFADASDSIKSKFQHPEILKNIAFRTQISESNKIMKMTFSINFDKIKEVDYFLADLDKMQGESGGGMPGLGGGGGLFPSAEGTEGLFKLAKKRKLTRFSPPTAETLEMENEELQMMKMFFSEASYTTIYNLPGKVKKTSIPNATVEGKKLILITPLMDIIEGKADLGGDICFKRR
ncbi:MAG: hypothetical protein ACI85Q_002929 [Salibacteraceae bacterium]|jgi:hypothetical protein